MLVAASAGLVIAPVYAPALSRAPEADPAPVLRRVDRLVLAGETFTSILETEGVPREEIARWERTARRQSELRRLAPGRALGLEFGAGERLLAMSYDLNGEARLVLERGPRGVPVVRREPAPVRMRTVGARGTVGRSLKDTALRAGIPEAVISQMVDLLSWRLDFKEDVHRGDRFRLLWERRTTLDGRALRPGRVLAVEYVGRSESAAAYLYRPGKGEPIYVDADGHRLDGAPLRFPLEFSRITSTFSDARFHPVLHRNRPHLGIDFAAPAGTPVRAIGAASVQFSGVQGGFGRHVELDHGRGFVSAYSHLQRIAPRVRAGARVRHGEIIGWVGSSGLATGPHLHFAIFDRGQYVDPLSIKYPAQETVLDPEAFARWRGQMVARLQAIGSSSPVAPTAPEIGLPPLAQVGRSGPITLTF
ncbi:MAG: M23 family metallopeptidase [Candidatus Binatia bacterium]